MSFTKGHLSYLSCQCPACEPLSCSYMFLLRGILPALFWHPKWTSQSCFHAMFWNVTPCVLFTVFECPLSTGAAVTQRSLRFLISPLCYWCSPASQITGLIVCTRCNYWSAGNLFGLERFFSALVLAQLLLSSHVVNKWTLGLKKTWGSLFKTTNYFYLYLWAVIIVGNDLWEESKCCP